MAGKPAKALPRTTKGLLDEGGNTMSQATNFRFFFRSTLLSPTKYSPFSFSVFSKPRSIFTVLAASSSSPPRRHRDFPHRYPRRNHSSQRESGERDRRMEVEESGADSSGFNKKRAEGRDKNDKPVKKPQLKTRKLNPANTISYLQILGTGMDTQDTAPSVLLFFDKQRFIFNAGEGLQRFCTEHKIKLSKIDHIFLSRVCSETAGGLPGLLLTLAGIGEEGISVNVWGPSDLKYLVDAMKSFIPNAAMVHTRSFGPAFGSDMAASFEPSMFRDPMVLVDDEVVKISAIFLWPKSFRSSQILHKETKLKNTHREDRVDQDLETAPGVKSGDMSVIYICELPEIKGKFDPSKAAALGLRPGPKYRELQLGNPVKSDRKNIMVYPSDVMDPSVPGPIVLLVDCPTEAHSQELLSMQSLSAYHAEGGKTVTCMIHLSPASVIRRSNYQEWMKRFHSAQHIMAGHERKNVEIPVLKSSARTAARLNYLCPQFFPAPGFWCLQDFNHAAPDSVASSEVHDLNSNNSILAENLLKFTLRPYAHLGLDRSSVPSTVALSEIINELHSEIPEIVGSAEQVSQLWNGSAGTQEIASAETNKMMVEEPWLNEITFPSCLENIRRDDLEIVLLGTGSSQPSKYRNVSSIYINLFSKGGLLLDCGEGTLGQLKRRYGVHGADDAVRGLSCIWISHIHADHHTGLARILALRRDLLKGSPHEPILVIGPRQLKRYLDAYQRLEDLDMQFLDCRNTSQASLDSFEDVIGKKDLLNNEKTDGGIEKRIDSSLFAGGLPMQSCWRRQSSVVDDNSVLPVIDWLKKVLNESGLEALVSFPVVHCPQAYGVVVKAGERVNVAGKVIPGWKLVYSGDTRPCPELVKASHGATVLIHEATFEDGLVEEAIARNHSTTKEAIEMGNKAGTFRIILTHFSQRYPKIPVFAEKDMHKTCIGFDMMSINAADLIVLPKVLPFLKLLFKNDLMAEDQETDDVVDDKQDAASSLF